MQEDTAQSSYPAHAQYEWPFSVSVFPTSRLVSAPRDSIMLDFNQGGGAAAVSEKSPILPLSLDEPARGTLNKEESIDGGDCV